LTIKITARKSRNQKEVNHKERKDRKEETSQVLLFEFFALHSVRVPHIAKILPRISRIYPLRPNQFPIREIRGSIPFGCGWPRCVLLRQESSWKCA
jgi:hypothetical protein